MIACLKKSITIGVILHAISTITIFCYTSLISDICSIVIEIYTLLWARDKCVLCCHVTIECHCYAQMCFKYGSDKHLKFSFWLNAAVSRRNLIKYTAWNVFKYGVISGPYFPVFSPNARKYGPKSLLFGHFSCSDSYRIAFFIFLLCIFLLFFSEWVEAKICRNYLGT